MEQNEKELLYKISIDIQEIKDILKGFLIEREGHKKHSSEVKAGISMLMKNMPKEYSEAISKIIGE